MERLNEMTVIVQSMREQRDGIKAKIFEYEKVVQAFSNSDEYSIGVRDTLKEVIKDLRRLL